VLPSGCAGGLRELVEIPAAVDGSGALACRPPTEPAECAQAAQTHEADVGPQVLLGRLIVVFVLWSDSRLSGWKLRRAQHGGNIQGASALGGVILIRRCRRVVARSPERRDGRVELCGRGVRGRDGGWLEQGLRMGPILLALLVSRRIVWVLLLVSRPRHYEIGRHEGIAVAPRSWKW
jgi:hypothetical protein